MLCRLPFWFSCGLSYHCISCTVTVLDEYIIEGNWDKINITNILLSESIPWCPSSESRGIAPVVVVAEVCRGVGGLWREADAGSVFPRVPSEGGVFVEAVVRGILAMRCSSRLLTVVARRWWCPARRMRYWSGLCTYKWKRSLPYSNPRINILQQQFLRFVGCEEKCRLVHGWLLGKDAIKMNLDDDWLQSIPFFEP